MKNPYFIRFNFNPWKRAIDDCAIRAISGATGLSYKEVCRRYGAACKNGYGLVRKTGIDLNVIKEKFSEYFDVVEDFVENMSFVPDGMEDTFDAKLINAFEPNDSSKYASGDTLNDFCEMFDGEGNFLVGLTPNPNAKNQNARIGGHAVYAKLKAGLPRRGFIDTWDSGEMLVDTYMRVAKTEPVDSPFHYKYDRANHCFIV